MPVVDWSAACAQKSILLPLNILLRRRGVDLSNYFLRLPPQLVLACATGEVKIFAAPNFECVGTYMCEEPIMTMEACEAVQKAVVQLQEDSSKRAEEDGAAVEGSGVPGMAASSTAAGEAIVAICCMSGKCSIVRFTYDHDERGAPATATTAAAADL